MSTETESYAQEQDDAATSCTFLKNPISLTELVGNGAKFDVNTNFDDIGFTNDVSIDSEHEDDNEEDVDLHAEQLVSPWTKTFDELRQQMVQVHEYMHKRVEIAGNKEKGKVPENARVSIRYSAYWEGHGTPFDSSFMRGTSFVFCTGQREVLEGLEAAVRTMYIGETALFIISYHMLYHELGCPPRIKASADGLFKIEVINFNLIGDINAIEKLSKEERNQFKLIIESVKQLHLKGLDFFTQASYRKAIVAFERAVNALNFCRLADEHEERAQTEFLIKLYTNLSVCYNKINAPNKTCIMTKQLRRLTNNKPSCKALFQEGRALFMLGEYQRAHSILYQALKIQPNNIEIQNELRALDERSGRYAKSEREIWTKAMGMVNSQQQEKHKFKKLHKDESDEDLLRRRQQIENMLNEFKNNLALDKIHLPRASIHGHFDMVEELVQQMDMSLYISPLDTSAYVLSKKSTKPSKK